MANTPVVQIKSENDLKLFLHKHYMAQIKNFFASEKQAMKFLSSVMTAVQKLPKLLECEPTSLINSFMTMAQLGLMPSDVSGEAYVLPYKDKAQFQLGYQGLVTLFYRAGGQKIRAEIVREHDVFSFVNGEIQHTIDITKSNEERGKAIAAYAIGTFNGQEIAKAMNSKDILAMGQKFSKSFASDYSPWKEANDPELMMWKKTVLKQLGKLLPKNETIYRAIAEDNKDSIIQDRLDKATQESQGLTMGAALAINGIAPADGIVVDEASGKSDENVQSTAPMERPPVVEPAKDLPPADDNESPAKKAMRAGMKSANKD